MCVFRVFSFKTNPNCCVNWPANGIFYDFAANVREFITFINIKLKNELDPKLRTRLIQNIFLMVDKKFKNGNSYKFSDVWSKIRPVYTLEFDSKTKAVITRRFNEICNAFCLDSIKPNVGLICKAINRCYQQYGEFFYGQFFEAFYAIKEEENSKMQYENEKQNENKVETESKEVSSEEINNNNDKDQENETNDIESTIEHFAETFNHFINGETFIRDSGTCKRSGRYLPLLEAFGSKYVRALEPLIRERMRLPENKGISRVVDRLNLDQNLLFEKLNSHYLSYTPDASLKCAKTRFLEAKRNVTKLFNRLCYFSFDIYVERSEVIEKIRENLETIINAIAACVEDSRYNKFEYDFMDLFRYYYKKEINNKESNNESKEVSSERTNNKNEKDQENEINENEPKEVSSEETNNNNDKDQENENEDNNTIENPWFFIIKNAKVTEVEV